MDVAANNMVNATLDMRQAQAIQQAQFGVFKEALDGQAAQITALMDSVALDPQLATSGSVGTQINTTA
ncbi:putative motility protein [Halomonas profundus]|uniref:putative motility protein n=1 Tax=Vreelandella titanicae TaxID=664683 RepID=UPI001F47770A|nr:putative motility protein [Halomonas titanicae]MCE7518909.1 putative motility protein [Halomonas titanicae]UEQ02407.1 putative motility protein [Halomonas profundus]